MGTVPKTRLCHDRIIALAGLAGCDETGGAGLYARDKLRQAQVLVRSDHNVGPVIGDEYVPEPLGHAPEYANNRTRAFRTEGPKRAQTAQRALLRVAAYRAGHHQQHVCFLLFRGLCKAGVGEHPAHHTGLIDVHLAAVGLDIELRQRIDILSVVPDCQGKDEGGSMKEEVTSGNGEGRKSKGRGMKTEFAACQPPPVSCPHYSA